MSICIIMKVTRAAQAATRHHHAGEVTSPETNLVGVAPKQIQIAILLSVPTARSIRKKTEQMIAGSKKREK